MATPKEKYSIQIIAECGDKIEELILAITQNTKNPITTSDCVGIIEAQLMIAYDRGWQDAVSEKIPY